MVTVLPENASALEQALGTTPYENIGTVTNGAFEIEGIGWGTVGEWKEKYDTAIEKHFSHYLPE